MANDILEKLSGLLNSFVDENECDIFILNGPINSDTARSLRTQVNQKLQRKTNVLLVLTTLGGTPDDGYRIARTLQRKYKKFSIYVPSLCKSTGTLIALGASEIIMGELGELGPLDMQLRKADELWETSSGLNVSAALSQVETRVCDSFSRFFFEMKQNFLLSTKTASDIACRLSEGIYKGIADQVDPIHLGETNRSISIAQQYGESLNSKSKNLKDKALNNLIAGYPSHSYVIDIKEAETLFNKVRLQNEKEAVVFAELDSFISVSNVVERGQDSVIFYVKDLIDALLEKRKQDAADASKQKGKPHGEKQESTGNQQDPTSKRSKDGGLSEQIESDVLPNSQGNGESVPLSAKKDSRTKSKSDESSQPN